MARPPMKLDSLKPYLMNVKALAGLGLIGFALYTTSTELPAKWAQYQAATANNKQLEQTKNNFTAEEAKLKAISAKLDELTIRLAEVPEGQSPELAGIALAQKVVNLSESTKNLYVTLQPKPSVVIGVDGLVSLPINIPGVAGASAAPGAPSETPPPPAPGGAAPTAEPAPGSLNAFQYLLTIRGTYTTLATFIQELTKFPTLVLINDIKLKAVSGTVAQAPESKLAEADGTPAQVEMDLTFTIPWKRGNNVNDVTVTQPQANVSVPGGLPPADLPNGNVAAPETGNPGP